LEKYPKQLKEGNPVLTSTRQDTGGHAWSIVEARAPQLLVIRDPRTNFKEPGATDAKPWRDCEYFDKPNNHQIKLRPTEKLNHNFVPLSLLIFSWEDFEANFDTQQTYWPGRYKMGQGGKPGGKK
jgi:hypothetical protein